MRAGFIRQASVRVHLAVNACTGRYRGLATLCGTIATAGQYPAAGYLAAIQLITPIDVSSLAEQGSRCLAWMLG